MRAIIYSWCRLYSEHSSINDRMDSPSTSAAAGGGPSLKKQVHMRNVEHNDDDNASNYSFKSQKSVASTRSAKSQHSNISKSTTNASRTSASASVRESLLAADRLKQRVDEDLQKFYAERPNKGFWYRFGTSKGIVVTLSMLCGLIFGYNTGVITSSLDHITEQYDLNTVQQGLVVCSTLLGALFGSVMGGLLADVIGRKPIILAIAITCIGGAISSAATSPLGLAASLRIILGWSVGAGSSVGPLMVSEVVPPEKRGRWGSVFQISVTVGLLIGNFIGLPLMKAPHNWRWMWAAGAAPGFPLLVVWALIHESPKFQIMQRIKKEEKAINDANGIVVHKETWMEILRKKKNRRPMFIGFVLAVISQWTGINAFMYFSTIIFEFAGFTQQYAPLTCSSILQFWNVSTAVAAMFLVDVVGRRMLLFAGAITMTFCDLLMALFFVVLDGKVQGWLCIVLLFGFVGAFELSIGTLFWFVINEILDDDIKNIGTPIITALQWLFNLLLSFTFLSAVKYIGQSTMFWIFGGVGLVCIVLLAIFLPPAKGNTQMGVVEDNRNQLENEEREFDQEEDGDHQHHDGDDYHDEKEHKLREEEEHNQSFYHGNNNNNNDHAIGSPMR
ncbi:sugar transporter family protein [Cavenderia fasciculata]|uniref:Sugar transporter family protein n=1 Tax=Cavenderia fasciculata TaxID=261658 RepID=F4PJC2_CACFS|nr:sugar transporter family protein [Cavenderia fasciculata]EGG24408.1 sugar transporter family protein [Cavenderia fasciculata]|eukprot:XP_004362259.1 sugar transporter family protein [Cavenderia fasciculata]